MFEAVYITDAKHALVYEYLVSSYSPHFLSISPVIEATRYEENSDPLKSNEAPLPLVKVNQEFHVCSRKDEGLILYLLFSTSAAEKTNPLTPFLFINRLLDVMHEYFGAPLTVSKVDANTDTLTLLLNEMIDNGIPNITDSNQLRDLVSVKSFLSKILSSGTDIASAASKKTLSSFSGVSKPSVSSTPSNADNETVPWRRANVKYTNNEMYVDFIETVNVILKPKKSRKKVELLSSQNFDSVFYSTSTVTSSSNKLSPVTGSINGQLDFLCRLSGEPSLQIAFNSASSYIEAPRFHPCINVDSWQRSKDTLSFIPPDGQSTLMSYQVDLDNLPQKKSLSMLGLPEFDCQSGLGINENEFEVRVITSKHHGISKIDAIKLEVFAFEQNVSLLTGGEVSDDDENESNNMVNTIKSIKVTHGDFRYKGEGKGEWVMKDLVPGVQPVFRGCIHTADDDALTDSSRTPSLHENLIEVTDESNKASAKKPVAPLFYNVSFTYKGGLASGLKIDNLKVISSKGLGDSVKPYKGVRYITTTGDYAIRM
ncbi:hypothetical protein FT663_02539 [Candidozyma haemuli var. vulneris]|uniref:MHD domain-containing protein n=1 Tax=Candidozyma haemuli TaxID=45357 RepID=A0A2V1AMY7_9ASCO|nr:hypothetical protein CXQ85_001377 [[Candida] haemuloni]KAF3989713.1 hypothetical protein FT662_02688 [[Candida] haemuloni var. vulneris]KAF3991917.1 hypothetical protein FT663_02539 [[Candida] haemuloni var. vulneris]PVH19082.1 hypothetical protein CXQ85_001377 [[Candida] haemuloni]